MAPISIILVILSAAIHVSWNYLTKSSSNPKLFSLLKGTLLLLFLLFVLPIIPLSSIPKDVWTFIVLSGIIHAVFFLLENSICYLLFGLYLFCSGGLTVGPVWKKEWRYGVLAALCTLSSYSLILHVMQTETVSYIVTLRQSSILFAVLTGWKALKEPYGSYRLFVTFFMLIGFFLVATG